MADEQIEDGPPVFRCQGVRQIATGPDGSFALVEMVEVSGPRLMLAFPTGAANELANRILAAAELARTQQAKPQAGATAEPPAPLATDHTVVPASDGDTMLLTLMSGPVPFNMRLSRSRSEKLRASLERCEQQLQPSAANSNA